ncbi:MAG: hypothetical protein IT258_06205 [Saprospiraceae bacterium]|nr:hypothetical protein [Saprospiraceae bacterium]
MKKTILFYCLLMLSKTASSQDLPTGFKNWLSVGIELKASKNLTLEVSQLSCMDFNPYQLQFSQLSFGLTYKLRKNTYLLAGAERYFFRFDSGFDIYHKFSAGIQLKNTFNIPLKQSIEVEYFTPSQKKHQIRGVYSASYSPKIKNLPMKARPFIKGMLYYYYGGAPLTYYGNDGETLAKQAPNDFHRFRLLGGFVFQPTKHWDMTLYYGWNKEFNTPFFENRDLNIPSKNGSKIKYPFNDYTFLGLSFTYHLNLESNGKQKSTEKNNHRPRG